MDDIYEALADKTRRVILSELAKGDRNVKDLGECLKIKQSTLSGHLATLRKTKLVKVEIINKWRWYSLNGDTWNSFVSEINRSFTRVSNNSVNEIILRKKVY